MESVVSLLSLLALPQIWDVLVSQHYCVTCLFEVLVSVSAERLAAVRYQLQHRLDSYSDSQTRDLTLGSAAPVLDSHEHRASSTRPAHQPTTCLNRDSKPHLPYPLTTHIISSSPHSATQPITTNQSLHSRPSLQNSSHKTPPFPKRQHFPLPLTTSQPTTPSNPQHHTSPSISALALFQKVDRASAPTKPLYHIYAQTSSSITPLLYHYSPGISIGHHRATAYQTIHITAKRSHACPPVHSLSPIPMTILNG